MDYIGNKSEVKFRNILKNLTVSNPKTRILILYNAI